MDSKRYPLQLNITSQCCLSHRYLRRKWKRSLIQFMGIFIALILTGGCASLDATDDINTAVAHIESRRGFTPDWEAPWDEVSPAWDGATPLSSDTAVIVALQNNRSIRRQVESIVATRADYVQAHLLPNPVISIALGFPIDGLGGEPLAASLIQQLAWIWTRPARIDAAGAALQMRVLDVSNAVLTLVADVRTAQANVVFAERAIELQERNCNLISQSLELVRHRFDVGESTQLDVNRLQLDLLRAQAELVQREAALSTAKIQLLELLGRAEDSVTWTTDDWAVDWREIIDALDEEQVMDAAASLRLDVAAAETQTSLAEYQLELAELGQLLDVSAGVGFQENFNDRQGVFPTIKATPKIFDDNSARIARAESELRALQIEADRIYQQAQREVRTAWIELQAEFDLIFDYQQHIVDLADENARLAEDSFAAGTVDLTVLLEAQRQQTNARMRLNDLHAHAVGDFYELERAAGGTLDPATLASLRTLEAHTKHSINEGEHPHD